MFIGDQWLSVGFHSVFPCCVKHPEACLMKSHVFETQPHLQGCCCSNSKSATEGHLLAFAAKPMAADSVDGDAIPLTGDLGSQMMKTWFVALFSGSIQSQASNLPLLLATSATNCGISSSFSFLVVPCGFLPTLVDLLQKIGRACSGPRSVGGLQSVPVTCLADQAGEVSQTALNPVD
jgi:hypothetical protein